MYRETLRQAWVELDMGALDHNVKEIRRLLGDVRMIGVVKANAYGHGIIECAEVLSYNGCDCFAVATIEEALQVKNAGIEGDIVILGLTPIECAGVLVENDFIPVIMSLELAQALSNEAVRQGRDDFRCLFAVDTGMGRIGYRVFSDVERKFATGRYSMISELPGITIDGVLTHFSSADEEDREYTEGQIASYRKFMDELAEAGYHPKEICANSAAIMNYKEAHFDAARPGIIMYGLAPSDYLKDKVLDLRPVMSVHAEVLNLQTVPAGYAISYSRKYVTERETKIATIGIGYADGYSRLNSGGIYVLCGGIKCPVIGNICMDMCMVDVTDVPDVSYGDEVVVMGRQGDAEYTAEDIAAINGTINYEILCCFGLRLPKVYKNYPEGMKK